MDENKLVETVEKPRFATLHEDKEIKATTENIVTTTVSNGLYVDPTIEKSIQQGSLEDIRAYPEWLRKDQDYLSLVA